MEYLKNCVSLLFILAVAVNYAVATETELRAYVGTTVALPCKVDEKQCGQLHSVKWYKDANRVYILSHAGEGRAEGDATERMSVQFTANSVETLLKISPVKGEDEATYKCEITYIEVIDNCDVVQIVKLKTLKKPDEVKILDDSGKSLGNSTILGPKEEGSEVDLTCEATGGKPAPIVRWFNGTREFTRAEYTVEEDGDGLSTGRSTLQLTLTRGDLLSRYECRVESEALDEPILSWITVDVHVPPTKIDLSGVKNHVVQGTNVLLICDVHGARPAATVRWANGSFSIKEAGLVETIPEHNFQLDTKIKEERDGTYTTKSSLIFKASHYENGRTIYCYAHNEVMEKNSEPELHASIILDVRYPPVITLSPLNITVNESTSLSEDNTVLLKCLYFANPQELKAIVWSKDGRNLTLNDTNKYNGGTLVNPPVYIKNVVREDMGEYTCSLKNEVGSETSEDSIFLNVQYPPAVEVVMEPSTPIKSVEKKNVFLQCNVTTGNPSTLQKVRWFLDGQLMKEFPDCNYTSYDENGAGEGNGGPFCGLDPSILSLEKVDETFSGNYTCQGENVAGWGNTSEPRELIVYYPPSPAKLRYYPSKVVKGASVTLECTVDNPGIPNNLTYIWFRGLHQMGEITTSNFTISPVWLETRNNFTCTAENEGGKSDPATVFINVNAPPAFIQKLPPYQGVLYSSQNINLTCIVECYPECSIIWKKDGVKLDVVNNHLYRVETTKLPADFRKNDFESINSTLIWNMEAWPGKMLNKTAPNSIYACESMPNNIGAGVNSTIEIAVEYPPENIKVSSPIINVTESQIPSPVTCHAEGRPTLTYEWKKAGSVEPISSYPVLALKKMYRFNSSKYACEARNKHGVQTAVVYFNVQYPPTCSLSMKEESSNQVLVCEADANPAEVNFTWRVKKINETTIITSNIENHGLLSFLYYDSSSDTEKIYYCTVNNTVGSSMPCYLQVAGSMSWWSQFNQDKMIIIIAALLAIIIVVIIICLIIVFLCRRKRADTKSPKSSGTEDNGKLGAAPPVGNKADPFADPDKGFYENLPFHGMQNPPNKPVSIITPFIQGNTACSQILSSKSLPRMQDVSSSCLNIFDSTNNKKNIKRNQSFNGFQQMHGITISPYFSKPDVLNNTYFNSFSPHQFKNVPIFYNQRTPNRAVSLFSDFSCNFSSGIPYHDVNHQRTQVNTTIPHNNIIKSPGNVVVSNRIIGRNEQQFDIRRTASGINLPNTMPIHYRTDKIVSRKSYHNSRKLTQKRFSSLEIKKQKCYSPTFYSIRAKKHVKRSVAFTLPNTSSDNLTELENKSDVIRQDERHSEDVIQDTVDGKLDSAKNLEQDFQNLTDSIQICEQVENSINSVDRTPIPAPRVKKRSNIVYANVSQEVQLCNFNNSSSSEISEDNKAEVSITQAQIHVKDKGDSDITDEKVVDECVTESNSGNTNKSSDTNNDKIIVSKSENTANSIHIKQNSVKPIMSSHALKNSPVLKVSPNFKKPEIASPKGALSQQIKAKTKPSCVQDNDDVSKTSDLKNDINTNELFPEIPQMPILNTPKWSPNITNSNKNAFYTLTTPHFKQQNTIAPPQYSTVPHQKHAKLIPKALFQEQLPKSKSFSSKSKQKKNHFQIPLQKCHSFKLQTAESYFQPIKNIHEENLMRNGYVAEYSENIHHEQQQPKRDKPKQKTKGPLVVCRPGQYQENIYFQENIQNSVQLQYPQPIVGLNSQSVTSNTLNGIVYADLDIPTSNNKQSSFDLNCTKPKSNKSKPKTEYATLKFNEVGQEIDV